MHVRVRLFAALRERAGSGSVELELPDGAVLGDVWPALGLGDEPPGILYAVNRAYADPATPLAPSDEVAVIPPVSGGSGEEEETPRGSEPQGRSASARGSEPQGLPGSAGGAERGLPASARGSEPQGRSPSARGSEPQGRSASARGSEPQGLPGSAGGAERGLPASARGSEPQGLFRLSEVPLALDDVVARVRTPDAGAIATFVGTTRAQSRGRAVVHLEYEAYEGMAEKVMADLADALKRRHDLCEVAIHHRVGRVEIGETSVVIAVSAPHRADALEACREAIDELKVSVPLWKKEVYVGGEEWIGRGS